MLRIERLYRLRLLLRRPFRIGRRAAILTLAARMRVQESCNMAASWQNRKARALDERRTKLLRQMLKLRDRRKLSTLARVVGADGDTTRRLLIELGARGSEKPRNDGEEVWGLISKPFGADRVSSSLGYASSSLMGRFVMEPHQLVGPQRHHRVRLAVVIAKFDFIHVRGPVLNDAADLASDQSFAWQVLQQCHHRMHRNLCHQNSLSYST